MAAAEESENERSLLISDNSVYNHGSVKSLASTISSVQNMNHFTGRGQKLFATLCILITELCERLGFYGLTANLVLLCSHGLGLSAPWPSTITLIFTGWCIF